LNDTDPQSHTVTNELQKQKFLERVEELTANGKKVQFFWLTSANRTAQQNRALHNYYQRLSKALNEGGYTFEQVIDKPQIPWTSEIVKNNLWRKIQVSMTGKQSTRDLSTAQVSEVYEAMNAWLGSNLGIHVAFGKED